MLKNLYLPNRFFWLFGALALFFVLSFALPFLYPVAQAVFCTFRGTGNFGY